MASPTFFTDLNHSMLDGNLQDVHRCMLQLTSTTLKKRMGRNEPKTLRSLENNVALVEEDSYFYANDIQNPPWIMLVTLGNRISSPRPSAIRIPCRCVHRACSFWEIQVLESEPSRVSVRDTLTVTLGRGKINSFVNWAGRKAPTIQRTMFLSSAK